MCVCMGCGGRDEGVWECGLMSDGGCQIGQPRMYARTISDPARRARLPISPPPPQFSFCPYSAKSTKLVTIFPLISDLKLIYLFLNIVFDIILYN